MAEPRDMTGIAFEDIRDEDIDCSDIPEITDFSRFRRIPFPEWLAERRAKREAQASKTDEAVEKIQTEE